MLTQLKPYGFTVIIAFLATAALAADDLPKTLMTTRGKLLVSEDFAKPLAPFTGKPVGFASGFEGWKYNGGPGTGHGGRWALGAGRWHF